MNEVAEHQQPACLLQIARLVDSPDPEVVRGALEIVLAYLNSSTALAATVAAGSAEVTRSDLEALAWLSRLAGSPQAPRSSTEAVPVG